MTNKGKILAGAAVVLALGAAGAVAAHQSGAWRGHGGWHGGWRGHHEMGFGGPMHRLCRGDLAEKADHVLVRLEHRVKPTEAQKASFDELKEAMRSAAGKISAACPPKPEAAKDGERPPAKSVPERLAMAESQLAATLDAVRTVRPAAEKFYAALSDDQKRELSQIAGRHGGKFGGRHHRWRDGERGGPDGGDDQPERRGPAGEAQPDGDKL